MASAKEIAANGLDEMSQRNAISRAYYAAYHTALQAIPHDGRDRGNVGVHKNYIIQLKSAANGSAHRKIGMKLAAMHTRRVDADYGLLIDIPKGTFALQVDQHSELIDLLNKKEESPVQQRPQLKCIK